MCTLFFFFLVLSPTPTPSLSLSLRGVPPRALTVMVLFGVMLCNDVSPLKATSLTGLQSASQLRAAVTLRRPCPTPPHPMENTQRQREREREREREGERERERERKREQLLSPTPLLHLEYSIRHLNHLPYQSHSMLRHLVHTITAFTYDSKGNYFKS